MAEARIVVAIDPRPAVQGGRVVVAEFNQITRASRRMDQQIDRNDRSMRQFGLRTRNLRGSILNLRNAFVALGGALGVREYVRLSDTYALLQARLRLATRSQAGFLRLQEAIFQSSQETRSALEGTIALYTRLERSTRQLGIAQSDLIDLTELVNQAFRVSGTGAAEQAGAVIQFSQAIATGFAAAGQEINSILEQAPRLAQALTDGLNELGVTSNATSADLKRLAQEGVLTTDNAVAALLTQTDKLDREFQSLPRTVGQALTQLGNSFLRTVGEVSQATDSTGSFVEVLDELREIVESPGFADGLEVIATGIGLIAEAAALGVKGIGSIKGAVVGLVQDLGDAFNALPEDFRRDFDAFFTDLNQMISDLTGAPLTTFTAEVEAPSEPLTIDITEGTIERRIRLTARERTELDKLIASLDEMGEARKDVAEATVLLDKATQAGVITEERQAQILALLGDEYQDLLEPMAAVTKEFQEQRVAEARARDNELLSRTIQQLTKDYEANLEAINRLNVSEEERARLRTQERLDLLEERTDLEAGAERFFTKFVQESQDAASAIEAALTEGIDAVNQSLEDLIVTGETSVENLQETLLRRGTRKALETLEAGLFTALGFGGGEDAATTANTTATAANTLALTANTSALLTASAFGGASSALAGASFLGTEVPFASSAIGGNPIATFLGSFQSGGAGRIPGTGPADSVLAMARVTPGEPFAFGGAVGGGEDVAGALRGLTGLLAAIANNTRGTELNLRATGDTFGTAPTIAASDAASLIQNAVRSNSN